MASSTLSSVHFSTFALLSKSSSNAHSGSNQATVPWSSHTTSNLSLHHFVYQLLKSYFWLPAKNPSGLGGVAHKMRHIEGSNVLPVDSDSRLQSNVSVGAMDELSNRVSNSSSQHIIVR